MPAKNVRVEPTEGSGLDRPLVSLRHLASLLGRSPDDLERIASHAGRYYVPFDTRRQCGKGKWRHIDNPCGELKALQHRIHSALLRPFRFPPEYCGGLSGRRTVDNAAFHLRPKVLVCLDLKNCFPTITHRMVYESLRRCLDTSCEVANLLTKLTTFQHRLPQGAPTSPVLANMVLMPMYSEIRMIAGRFNCAVSFYVDDIAVSGQCAREAMNDVIKIIQEHGFAVSNTKTRVLASHVRQEITGIVVNNRKPSISRTFRANIRRRIIELADSQHIAESELQFLRGRIGYVKSVSQQQGLSLEFFADRLLPVHGESGPRRSRCETRPCRDFRRNHAG